MEWSEKILSFHTKRRETGQDREKSPSFTCHLVYHKTKRERKKEKEMSEEEGEESERREGICELDRAIDYHAKKNGGARSLTVFIVGIHLPSEFKRVFFSLCVYVFSKCSKCPVSAKLHHTIGPPSGDIKWTTNIVRSFIP